MTRSGRHQGLNVAVQYPTSGYSVDLACRVLCPDVSATRSTTAFAPGLPITAFRDRAPGVPSAYREVLDILRTGTQEIEEVDVLVFARLADAQQNQIIPKAFLRGFSLDYATKRREGLDGMLRIVVVPWHVVEI